MTATGYRTFSSKLVTALQVFGAALVAAGGLGLQVRATATAGAGLAPEELVRVWGFAGAEGWILATAGLLAGGGAAAWRLAGIAPRAFAAGTALVAAGLAVWRLRAADLSAARLVTEAQPTPEVTLFHAGFGWGAWLLLVATILLGLAVLAGALRAWDLRPAARGHGEGGAR